MARFSIRYLNYDLELPVGRFVIGRSPDCQLALDDPLISRKHATLHVDDQEVVFEDLGSRNGSTINGESVRGKRPLEPGDKIGLGSQEIRFLRVADPRRGAKTVTSCASCGTSVAPDQTVCPKCGKSTATTEALRCTACGALAPADQRVCPACGLPVGRRVAHQTILKPLEDDTRQTSAFRLLAGVADKALAMGRVEEAERILANLLKDFRQQVGEGKSLESDSLEDAAAYALRLAEALQKPSWIDWVFDLYGAAGRLLPGRLIDSLHLLVRRVRYPLGGPLRRYLASMQASSSAMTPAERFLLKRLDGLRAVCASQ